MNLTIIIPTFNRSNFLIKTLRYYSNLNFKSKFLILDSSKGKERQQNFDIISRFKNLNLKYVNVDGKPLEVIKKSKKYIKTKYCLFSGDDDYLIKSCLLKIINFLNKKKNQKYAGANGMGILFSNYYNYVNTKKYESLFFTKSNKSIKRLEDIINDYRVSHFSVCRSKYFISALEIIDKKKLPHRAFYDEIAFSITLAIYGKFHQFEDLFLLRETSHQRNNLWSEINDNDQKISLDYLINYLKQKQLVIDNKIVNIDQKFNNFKKMLKKNFKQEKENKKNFLKKIMNFYNTKIYFWIYMNFPFKFIFLPIEIYRNLSNYYSTNNLLKDKKFSKDFKIFYDHFKK